MKRICIIGICGAGKSTFARKLAEKTGFPLIHLDLLFWENGLQQVSREVFWQRQEEIFEMDSWIIDGTYPSTLLQRLARADTLIWLNFSTWQGVKSVLKRAFFQKEKRSDMPSDFEERLDKDFSDFILFGLRTCLQSPISVYFG